MQQGTALPDDGRPTQHFRNTAYVIDESRPYFDAAYAAGLMGVYGRSTSGRSFALGAGPVENRARIIDFVRCSYLGLDNHPMVIAGAIDAIEAHRSLHWSCARTRLNFDHLAELEATLSEMFRARVIAFSTVMLANLGAMPLLASGQLTGGQKPLVVFDRIAHISLAYHKPAVADEARLETIAHNDLDSLERLCRDHPVVAYVCDGVYSMGGNAPVNELRQLQERYGLFLYIDDAHGISLFGHQGEGFARSQFPQLLGDRTIIAASLAKGFGASGGMLMLGTADHEDLFRRYSIPYAFSVPPNLAAVGAALGSCKVHRSAELGERQMRLARRIEAFDRRVATAEQGNSFPIRMIATGSEARAIAIARELLDAGFYTLVTFFPTVARGRAGIRVCITADHEFSDIDRLCDCILEKAGGTYGRSFDLT
ncbi:aminotransferase class I/II-fold pyridoxal phosphate-dependent enzyme [Bradyrhizobium sp. 4]|uniref:aminotransferase class I/II-fold pyridoxal phosphate-dependent enzyme n=1 Tax=unclassified Bradyrhizobium TaxID=2631580 RepID=UPI001FF8870D|nr:MULTISPECIES: aminotransferase class I/II-fold pyridoxal phosphate-dependent enzyme [unclassified Bradyrhizobium]MCK1403679.1 aminotransferase class I/II-fold pyridoxal phosphate-dependent enzyme [Bradyrhizobium sp. 39]MCK1634624.1 aminotransferase class I/II-fold pyridoxal phosphate-dependent enzyme [Bradyrhizobium sp. 162]MCK1751416.1 aminotransferase class I/II-fold pyridoxal phosphate-dependent enzyme [Bradyrhizobium sp. 135]UPJ36435.1 aminotransferase class I/II-fold pyridoxal phosphate